MEEKEELKSNIKAIVAAFLVAAVLIGAFILVKVLTHPREYSKIIVSNFVAYDLVRAAVGNDRAITMLVEPGKNIHDYKPTDDDLNAIKSSDLFVYFGGKSESWVDAVINDGNSMDEKYLRLDNYVGLMALPESTIDKKDEYYQGNYYKYGEDEEFDEHVWMSLSSTITLAHVVADRLSMLYPEDSEKYYQRSQEYTMRLNDIDQQFRRFFSMADRKKALVFAGGFPFQYMFNDYSIPYYITSYCGEEQTGSDDEIAEKLIEKSKSIGGNIIIKPDVYNGGVINIIKNDSEIKVVELYTVHSISNQDFDMGVTFADIMERNAQIVIEALNGTEETK